MPFLPVSIIRPALQLLQPTTKVNSFPITATRLAGFTSPLALFSSSSARTGEMSAPTVQKSESEWQAQLSKEQVGSLAGLIVHRFRAGSDRVPGWIG